jgi:hypothetical protein
MRKTLDTHEGLELLDDRAAVKVNGGLVGASTAPLPSLQFKRKRPKGKNNVSGGGGLFTHNEIE